MSEQPPNIEQALTMLMTLSQMTATGVLDVISRCEAIEKFLSEIHPELRGRLEQQIQECRAANSEKFAELLKIQEFLRRTVSGPIQ